MAFLCVLRHFFIVRHTKILLIIESVLKWLKLGKYPLYGSPPYVPPPRNPPPLVPPYVGCMWGLMIRAKFFWGKFFGLKKRPPYLKKFFSEKSCSKKSSTPILKKFFLEKSCSKKKELVVFKIIVI